MLAIFTNQDYCCHFDDDIHHIDANRYDTGKCVKLDLASHMGLATSQFLHTPIWLFNSLPWYRWPIYRMIFPLKPPIYKGFSMPMLNNQLVNPKDINTWAGARGDPVPGATKKGDWSDLDQQ